MKKNQFKQLVEKCMIQFGKTMKAGNYTLNEGSLYNANINGGRAVTPLKDAVNQITKTMWREAKNAGFFEFNGCEYEINPDLNYYASFSENNGATYSASYEYTNKAEAIRKIREMAESNTSVGNGCRWSVSDADGNQVAAGGMYADGRRYREQ